MTRRSGLWCLLAALLSVSPGLSGQDRAGGARAPSTAAGDWTHYTADARGTKYSPLDQIDAANFGKLEVAWRFKTDILGPRPEYKLEGTPLAINGILYTTGGTRRSVVALYVKTGYRLVSLNAKNGAPISAFGKDGIVDLKDGVVFGTNQQIDLETGEI